ncbi:biopolymer transporter ExbD [uncultured Flavobacterium sp.]|jgi:biopolymer transport protein TolR|uniref:ExbD/TolR family protein n=1 Tax=uncultured Flavobacterium sp. TaxID=165435 RepID=UPI0030CA18E9|tara:strand:+ start:2331 stop:2954 length:624 start_codon:yes stop_codon:yes gene_type:complete
MAKKRGTPPEVNAGSMADIAFLLLIFFLVTTTIGVDQGINRRLPPMQDEPDVPPINERNILTVLVNMNNQLLVEEQLMDIKDLRKAAIKFLENNGKNTCDYCEGAKDPASSDSPLDAVISLSNDSETTYETYLAVQNELVAAYNFLRNRESLKKNGVTFSELEYIYNDPASKGKYTDKQIEVVEKKVKFIQEIFPQRLSEAEPKRSN